MLLCAVCVPLGLISGEQGHGDSTALCGPTGLSHFGVMHFQTFAALLLGGAVVVTFTVRVSKQLRFQRLLGVFVSLVFFTCGVGHLLEGLPSWKLTCPVNVPWTRVTAGIGFAVLVDTADAPPEPRGMKVSTA